MRSPRRCAERGTTTVEFAVVAVVLLMILFAVIEFGRALFMFAVLSEGTRRSARIATVCPVNSPAIANAAAFASLPGFSTANVAVTYLNQAGAAVANPAGNVATIRYVRVNITNYSFPLAIPFVAPTITVPAFAVTLPRESLGSNGAGGTLGC